MWVQKHNFSFYAKKNKEKNEGDKEKGYFFNFTCTSGKKEWEKLQ